MSAGAERLHKAIGSVVAQVAVEVLFYGGETEGDIGNIVVHLVDGRRFFLGCAGDGSVLVMASGKNSAGTSPGFTRVERAIVELVGSLARVCRSEGSVELTIGQHVAVITNEDDELSVAIDGRPMSREMLMRHAGGVEVRPFEQVLRFLRASYPEASAGVVEHPSGAVTIDVRFRDLFVVVQYSPLVGFGASVVGNDDLPFSGHDHTFATAAEVTTYLAETLR